MRVLVYHGFTKSSFPLILLITLSLRVFSCNEGTAEEDVPVCFYEIYIKQRRVNDEENISKDLKKKFTERILDYVLYDVANNQTLRNFEPIKHNTHCTFARSAVLWGAPDYREDFSLENNVEKCIPALMKLLILGEALHLDGFVIQLPGDEFGHDVELFGQGVRRVLKFISDCDPSGYHCMNKSFVSQIGWSFEFDGFPIFVTTFAPCYPLNHSRYAFEAQHGFVLLQPMYSFKIHNIGSDTIHTNWDNPKTIRDKIRVAYKENGRPYHIRNTLYYPMAHDIVKPMEEGSDKLVEWWKDRNNTINDNNNTDESDIN